MKNALLLLMLIPVLYLQKTTVVKLNIIDNAWNETLEKSGLKKTGMDRLNYKYYQYEPVGLGGTVIRVDPWGFGYHRAPGTGTQAWHQHEPYFGYEFWWDKEAHRFNPFLLKAGYGASFDPGTITAFNHHLDIRTGILNIDLTLQLNGISFTTHRNVFVTPEGILVIRVQDSGAPSPLKLNVEIEKDVRIYNNQGIYAVPHDPWSGSGSARVHKKKIQGGVITAVRPGTSTASLAVAVQTSSSVTSSANNTVYSTTESNGTLVFYIAPTSSFKSATARVPWDDAWDAAYHAKQKGYEVLRKETAAWWNNYLNRSKVLIPDENAARLYAQSLYYHGVYFGECEIPPGCNSTDIESFAGAVCPEYDLTFSQMALVYTGHLDEAKNVADWIYSILPKAKEYAAKGISHHNITRKYSGGAKYTTLTGYDGALLVQPTIGEGANLNSNYPGANSAVMALAYLDFSIDHTFREAAYDVLKSTTQVSLEDLMFDERLNAYRCKYSPSSVQQASVLFGYNECVKRGISEPEWTKYRNKILMPTNTLNGDTLLAGSVASIAKEGAGDAPWLQSIWWNGVVSKHDPAARPSYENCAKSKTGNYVFNNGTMGVVASKLSLGNEALAWLQKFQKPDILYDETCFSEVIGDYTLTPEIGAHGAYVCNLTQMLMDPDHDSALDIFPAIPDEWGDQQIGFSKLLAKGGLSVSAYRDIQTIRVEVTNNSDSIQKRAVKICIPKSVRVRDKNMASILGDGFILQNLRLLPGKTVRYDYFFSAKKS